MSSVPAPFDNSSLSFYSYLPLAAAVLTLLIKLLAWWHSDSVSILSDVFESGVNLTSALLVIISIRIARRPPDDNHPFGHDKAEYLSSGFTGLLIVFAAIGVAFSAVPRLFEPQPLQALDLALLLIGLANVINLLVAWRLRVAGKAFNSVALQAESKHLLVDVITTAGIMLGLLLTHWTGYAVFDAILALIVAAHIGFEGAKICAQAISALLDTALNEAELEKIEQILQAHRRQGIAFHALRTRCAGSRKFVALHVLVPGHWSVSKGHDLLETIEAEIRLALPGCHVFTHLEPIEDPCSWSDTELDRH